MAVVYASYFIRTGEDIKESVVCESTELAVDARVEDDESERRCQTNSIRSSAMSDVFSPFHISTTLLI